MKPARHSAALLRLPMVFAVLMAVSACQQQEEAAAPLADSTEAMPDAKPGIAASRGVLLLPPISGRPGVAYFNIRNDGTKATALAAVYIEGVGKAEMHKSEGTTMTPVDTVALAPGKTVKFEQGGLHIMAFDIDAALTKGGTTEMTLTFAGGDKLSMPVKIDTIGGAEPMAGMDHGDSN